MEKLLSNIIKKIIICGIILLSYTMVTAQNYIVNLKYLTVKDGLSHRQVNTIFQDKNGLIWIGTKNGLNSFNGYEFKHWLGKQGNVNTRNIHRIGQDDEGWLWLQRQDNLIFYNPKTNEFKTISERFGEDCILNDFSASHLVATFETDAFGRLYYEKFSTNEIYTYHSSEGFLKLDLPFELINYSEIVLHNDGLVLDMILGNFGKIRATRATNTSSKFEFKKPYLLDLNDKENQEITIDDFKKPSIRQANKHVSINYKNKTYWTFDDQQNIKIHDEQQHIIAEILSEKHPVLKNKFLEKSFFDNQNRMWLASHFGFYILEIKQSYFNFLAAPIINQKTLSARGIQAYQNQIFTVFEASYLFTFDNLLEEWLLKAEVNILKAIYKDSNKLWLGGFHNISVFDNKTLKKFDISNKNKSNSQYDLWFIINQHNDKNKLWIGTKSGLLSFDKISQKSTLFDKTNGLIAPNDFHIQTIIQDKVNPNHFWLCTNQGLILMDEVEGFIHIYHENNKGDNYLPAMNFQHLHQDKNGFYWLGTAGEGLIKWERKKQEFEVFSAKDGLANQVIYAVYEDAFENLWLSSDYGIIRFNKTTNNVTNFLLEHGIGQIEFNRLSHFQAENGLIYFGGLGGVTAFNPTDFQEKLEQKAAKLILSNFQQFNGSERKVEDKTTLLKDNLKVTLYPSDYIYDLEFTVLSYESTDKNQYRYQFTKDGEAPKNWQTQNARSIQLGQLPYGNHQLIVKGKDASGKDCKNSLTLEIEVLRPFYLQFWFIGLAVFILVSFIYYYITWRTKNLKKQQEILQAEIQKATQQIQNDKQIIEEQAEELKKLDKLKSTFFANVSHELRTPLTLMLAPIKSVLKRNELDNRSFTFLKMAEQNGYRLLGLVNEILDLNKLEASKLEIHEETVAFYPFIKRIAAYFTSYADDKKVNFQFNYQLENDLHLMIDTKKIEIIINNLLSNAFKFIAENGQIIVQVEEYGSSTGQNIQILVKDTGSGIHENDLPNIFNRFYQSKEKNIAEGGTGIGLALSKELAKLIGGNLTVESVLEEGSTFCLFFPKKEILKTISDEDFLISTVDFNTKTVGKKVLELTETKDRPTILIVEDNKGLQKYLKLILEEKYNVHIVRNGKQALLKLGIEVESKTEKTSKKVSPNLIISDLMMPIMDGYQLLIRLKKEENFRQIPFVMLTARAAKIDKLTALRIGVDDYILKPFDEEELLARIDNLLENSFARLTEKESLIKQSTEKEIVVSEKDLKWLEGLENLVLARLEDNDLTMEKLANQLSISTRQFSRKIKLLTGLTPNKYVVTIRLQQARTLLENNPNLTVKEVSYQVGFNKSAYFSKLFIAKFGKKPSEI